MCRILPLAEQLGVVCYTCPILPLAEQLGVVCYTCRILLLAQWARCCPFCRLVSLSQQAGAVFYVAVYCRLLKSKVLSYVDQSYRTSQSYFFTFLLSNH